MTNMIPTLLVGNDINNVNNQVSWTNLLRELIEDLNSSIAPDRRIDIDNYESKPFPLLYEEIYMKGILSRDISEIELKRKIANMVGKIRSNSLHERISSGRYPNILTTNYEHGLEDIHDYSKSKLKNDGLIRESRFSIFRNHEVNGIKFWHIHGDREVPNSILLGYEHYSGQLQQMRNYVISGTNYTSRKARLTPLVNRLGREDFKIYSWIDFFFNSHVHILGLSCDYTESDLWWLFTIRARRIVEKSRFADRHRSFLNVARHSKIVYYYPKKYYNREKVQLMKSNGIETHQIDIEDKEDYYHSVLDKIDTEYG